MEITKNLKELRTALNLSIEQTEYLIVLLNNSTNETTNNNILSKMAKKQQNVLSYLSKVYDKQCLHSIILLMSDENKKEEAYKIIASIKKDNIMDRAHNTLDKLDNILNPVNEDQLTFSDN